MQPPVDATSDGSSTAGPVRLAQVFAELGAALGAKRAELAAVVESARAAQAEGSWQARSLLKRARRDLTALEEGQQHAAQQEEDEPQGGSHG